MFTLSKIPTYEPKGNNSLNFFYGGTGGLEEPEFSIKSYVNIIYYQGSFLKAIHAILVEKDGFCEEGADCYYSDPNSPFPEDHFEGIRFEIGGLYDPIYQVYVSEEKGFMYLKQACLHFLELHPEELYKRFLFEILDNWIPY